MFITIDNYWKDADTFPIFAFALFDTLYTTGITISILGIGINFGYHHGGIL